MNTQALTTAPSATDVAVIEKVILAGDLKELKPQERLSYYNRVCESLGLNPLTQPFAYLNLSGKMTLYARKDAAEQLRSVREISLKILSREVIEGVYVVTVEASTKTGRVDSSTGGVTIEGLKGEARANAMMKAETKAKRRVTLSICGLGLMDETEVETIEGARKVSVETAHTQIEAGNGGVAGNAGPASVRRARPIPEELELIVGQVMANNFTGLATFIESLRCTAAEVGIEKAVTDRQAGIRASFPKGQAIPADVMIGFLLDVWDEITAAKAKAAEAPAADDKAAWLPDGVFEEAAK